MDNKFICQYCGKVCKSKLSKSCHERYCDLNPHKVSKEHLRQNAIHTNKNRYKNRQRKTQYILFVRKCEICGKLFYVYDVENRKQFPKCCSSECSHKLSTLNDNKDETKLAKCVVCGKEILINKRASEKTCKCYDCKHPIKEKNKRKQKEIKQKKITPNKKRKNTRKLTSELIEKLREAGKKSARIQAEIRRSKNEMEFCSLCEGYFSNVLHNECMFNGWDADIILPDIEFAVLWNGRVHYEPIFGQANYNRVINRDKIKLKEISKFGYSYYIIKDMGKYDKDFVRKKFNEFLEYLKEHNYI